MNRAQRRKQQKASLQTGQHLGPLLMEIADCVRKQQWLQGRKLCQRILKTQPDQPDALQLLGLICFHQGDLQAARTHIKHSLRLHREQPHVWYNLGKIYFELGDVEAALVAYNEAITLDPKHADAHYNRGNIYSMRYDYVAAMQDFAAAAAADLSHVEARRNLALTYQELGEDQKALGTFEALVRDAPNNVEFRRGYGLMLMESGQKDQAIEQLELVLKQEPNNITAHYDYSKMVKYDAEQRHNLAAMEALLAQGDLSDHDRAKLHFAIAGAYEQLKELETAFDHYHRGNATMRQTIEYVTSKATAYFERIAERFDDAFFAKHATDIAAAGQTPIFILGMPRSGTTLVEQILASHSDVTGCGEAPDLHYVVTGAPEIALRGNYLDHVSRYTTNQLHTKGNDYLQRMKRMSGGTDYFTDKMPNNFHYIGMIAAMLPQAKIIHCSRQPLDTCLSIYKRLFFGWHPYAYNQQELAEHYQLYEKLMTHWVKVVPKRIHTVSYEQLIHKPEPTIRALLTFCGLEWQEECLQFHQSKRAVHTASAQQVRKPIYKDAIDSWKPVAPYINEMITTLRANEHT